MKGIEILSDDLNSLSPKDLNQLIMRAGCVSHRSWGRSKKTPEQFIKMLWRVGHLSVLEHSWFTFKVSPILVRLPFYLTELELLKSNPLFVITEREVFSLIVSGNIRMFFEAYARAMKMGFSLAEKIIYSVLDYINTENPFLFPENILLEKEQRKGFFRVERLPSERLWGEEENLYHRAMTIRFYGYSRGFTHEDVRSRNGWRKVVAYTQESTRYVNYKKLGLRFIMPDIDENFPDKPIIFSFGHKTWLMSPKEIVGIIGAFYNKLIEKGFKPEEARQFLPIGIEAEIVQTMNLLAWKRWLFLRTSKAAHPEIRGAALKVLRECQNRFPKLFDDFSLRKDHAVYEKNDLLL